ncbi:hypothetical protein PanWU01x14_020600 [Parasponia andersonii]|uniref:Uncharacterized protein n=1 Tax=Parasponia andersonii TaxID=3476 RepID=A0A2P5DYQ6_PARAD|nr:hypothetical protein PanWU01x14_020600 [Parasponia andersonii]
MEPFPFMGSRHFCITLKKNRESIRIRLHSIQNHPNVENDCQSWFEYGDCKRDIAGDRSGAKLNELAYRELGSVVAVVDDEINDMLLFQM